MGRVSRIKPGHVYGQLTVLGRDKAPSVNARWKCRCTCGQEHVAQGCHLLTGQVQSCGCLQKENQSCEHLNPPMSTRRRAAGEVFRDYRKRAQKKGIPFELSLADVDRLMHEPCHYCGQRGGNTVRFRERRHGDYDYNGIDRRDSSRGYTPGNIVAACGACNKAKLEMGQREFAEHIRRIYSYWARQFPTGGASACPAG